MPGHKQLEIGQAKLRSPALLCPAGSPQEEGNFPGAVRADILNLSAKIPIYDFIKRPLL